MIEPETSWRLLILALAIGPYLGCVSVDAWMHERHRRVPRVEQFLHAGIGLGVGAFLLLAFIGVNSWALLALAGGLLFLGADEFGFHRALPRRERTVHIAGLGSLLGFVGVWAWTESLL